MAENFEEMVERVAKAWFERPCPPEEEAYCNADLHVWENGHHEDKAFAVNMVTFVLNQIDPLG